MQLLKKLTTLLLFLSALACFETVLLAQTTQTFRVETVQGRNVVAGEILVRFRDGTGVQAQALSAQDADLASVEPVGRNGTLRLRSSNRDTASLLQAYGNRLDVLYAEPNYIWRASDLPNDMFFGQQWALRNTGQTIDGALGTSGADIKAVQAWDITEGSRNIVVGVVDSGVDYTHPDLAANVWSAPAPFTVNIGGQSITCAAGTHGFNAIARTCDPMDDDGHGTHVAGIIAGSGNNGLGVSGISRVGSIMGLKFLSASSGEGTTTDAIAAIEFAIQVKALFPATANIRVLNASWGGTFASQALRDEIGLTAAADMLLVAAAGNDRYTNDLIAHYPSNLDFLNIIAVAATTNNDTLADFSNWGTTTVHLGAPGDGIISTLPAGTYALEGGTSMAAPMVSGAAALILSACPLTTNQLRANILGNVDPIAALSGKTTTGGRLNVYRAVTACGGSAPPGFRLSVTPGIQTTEVNGTVNLTVTVTPVGGFSGDVSLAAGELPAGFMASFNPSSVQGGSGTATLALTAGASTPAGSYAIAVTGLSGALTSTSAVVLTVGTSIAPQQAISGALTTSDRISSEEPQRYADFYRLTLASTTAVTIDLKSRVFDPYLYLRTSSGALLSLSDDEGGDNNSRISTTLAPGTYSIEVTSAFDGDIGAYSLTINTPTLSAISVPIGEPGTAISVTLTGTRFTTPLTINAGSGITVSNLAVASSVQTQATFTIGASAAAGARDITVTTADGTSNALTFAIPPAIAAGQRVAGSLDTSDPISPVERYHYADLYRLTLLTPIPVTIDLLSSAFTPKLSVLSSGGSVLFSDSFTGGQSNARITRTLGPGTFYIEASSLSERRTGNYELSINLPILTSISPRFRPVGSIFTATLTGNGFTSPMTVDAGSGVLPSSGADVTSATSATVILTIPMSASTGNRNVSATTATGTTNSVPFRVVPPILPITMGQSIAGALTPNDLTSLDMEDSYQDLYQFTITSTTIVNLIVQSVDFDAYLLLLSSTGVPLAGDDDSGGNNNPRLAGALGAGTYYLEVTSVKPREIGSYTISVGQIVLTAVTPNFGATGPPVNVTFTGAQFTLPLTVDAGPGITVTNVNLVSSTSATATLTIAPNAASGPRDISLTAFDGRSNPLTFTVFPTIDPISPGQSVSGTLSVTDAPDPSFISVYADMYRLTLTASTAVTVELNSTAFDSYLRIISATGSTLFTDNQSGGNNNARIQRTLSAGTYYLLASSFYPGVGPYTLNVITSPTLTGITPDRGAKGTTVGVRLTGTSFSAPMTISAGSGITVSNVNVLSSTAAIATFAIAGSATEGTRDITVTTPYGSAGGASFNVLAPQPSQLNFPRVFSPADLALTGFAVSNPSGAAASINFTLYSPTGSVVATVNETAPARGQFVKLGNEIFTTATQAGWIKATSSTVGLQSFWVGGNFTSYMDGAASSPAARELLFPLVTSQTEINVANVGSSSNSVTFRIYGASGTELAAAVTQNLPTNGIHSSTASSLFPSVNLSSNTVSIRAQGTLDIAGTSVTVDFPVTPSWTVVSGMDASLSLFEVNFAHVPSGSIDGGAAWLSVLGITNLSSSAQNALFTFTPLTGSPVQVTRTLAAGGTLRESVHTLFGFSSGYQEGWVKVTGTAALNGFIAYGFTGTNGSAVVPAQGLAQSTLIFSHVAMGPGWGTGLALLNATSTPANVEVYIMRKDGSLVGGAANVPTAAFTLPPNTKNAKLLEELVPAANANDGFVYVRTANGVPLHGLQLFFTRGVEVIANVAAGVIDPSITYTPPAP